MEDKNLSEVLFKPKREWVETSLISNSGCPLPEIGEEIEKKQGFNRNWYRSINRFYWTWLGGNLLDIEETLARIAKAQAPRSRPSLLDTVSDYAPGNWIYEFSLTGQMRVEKAKETAQSGDLERAAHHYRMASRYFAIASYPNLKGDVLASQAALLCRRAYREIFTHSTQCGFYSEETFLVNGQKVQGYLHSPDNKQVYPCVVMVGAYEQTATDFFRIFNDYFRPLGVAVFIVDMPGLGSCANLSLDQNCSEVLEKAILHLKEIPYINFEAIGICAGGISSVASVRLCLMHPNLVKALIVNNPYIHEVFVNQQVLNLLPLCLRSSLANRLGADAANWDTIIPQLQMLSLKKQGLLSVSSKCTVPILIVADKHNVICKNDVALLKNCFKTHYEFDKSGSIFAHGSMKVFEEGASFIKSVLALE